MILSVNSMPAEIQGLPQYLYPGAFRMLSDPQSFLIDMGKTSNF